MTHIKILIVEDEAITAQRIAQALRKEQYEVLAVVTDGESVLKAISDQRPDIILMDIHLSGKTNGIEVSRRINQLYNIPIIYVTGEIDKVFFDDAIQTFPLNYITKPFNDVVLLRAVSMAVNYVNRSIPGKDPAVFLYPGGKTQLTLKLEDILYIQAQRAYTSIYYADSRHQNTAGSKEVKSITLAQSSNHVLGKINSPSIIKVHRSYFINLHKIEKYHNGKITIGGNNITVSPTFRQELESRLIQARLQTV